MKPIHKLKPVYKLASLMLLIALMASATITTSLAAGETGCLDGVQDSTISGWAWNSASPTSIALVKLVVKKAGTSETVAEVSGTACIYREDLKNAGYGTGAYGFSIPFDWSALEPGVYRLEAYANGTLLTNLLQYDTVSKQVGAAEMPAVNLQPLGSFKATAYCPCARCCGRANARTSSGTIPQANHTISVDPRVIPTGSQVVINDVVYTAEDKGGGIKGNRIDIFFDSHQQALQYGVKRVNVYLVK